MIAPPRPPQNDTELLVKEARDRQRRRRLLSASVIAVAAGIAVGAFAVAGGFDQSPTARAPLGPGSVPLCRSSQLSRSIGDPIGLEFGPTLWITLTNTGAAPCSLPGGAPRAWITWRGTLLPTHEVHRLGVRPAEWYPLRPIHVLKPGAKAGVTLEWRNWCGRPHSNRYLMTFHLSFAGAAAISFPFGPHAACLAKGSPSTVLVSSPLDAR